MEIFVTFFHSEVSVVQNIFSNAPMYKVPGWMIWLRILGYGSEVSQPGRAKPSIIRQDLEIITEQVTYLSQFGEPCGIKF